jgi:hypothetical protein
MEKYFKRRFCFMDYVSMKMQKHKVERTRREAKQRRDKKPMHLRFAEWMFWFVLLIMVLTITVTIRLALIVYNYQLDWGEQLKERIISMESYLDETRTAFDKELEEEESLGAELYYQVKTACTTSDDEVLVRLFESEFPSDDTFLEDQAGGIVVLDAMLDNHPEIKTQSSVATAFSQIYKVNAMLDMYVTLYNDYLDIYYDSVELYNTTLYCEKKDEPMNPAKYQKLAILD